MRPGRRTIIAAAVFAILAVLAWLLRPLGLIRSPIMFLYKNEFLWLVPLLAALLVLGVSLAIRRLVKGTWLDLDDGDIERRRQAILKWADDDDDEDPDSVEPGPAAREAVDDLESLTFAIWPFGLALLTGVTGFFICLALVGGVRGREIYKNAEWRNLEPSPSLQTCRARLAPYEVWHNRANAQFTESQEQLEGAGITKDPLNGSLTVTFERAPRGFFNQIRKTTTGLALMDVESTAPKLVVPRSPGRFAVGVNNRWSDSLDWVTAKSRYLAGNREAVMVRKSDGEQLFVTPYIEWKGVIRRPVSGGVWVLHRDGRLEDFSPERAAKTEWLRKTGHVVSEDLARMVQHAYVWNGGIINNSPVGAKTGLIKVTEVGDVNSQPYLTELCGQGLKWVTIASPQGRANAVSAVFLTDSVTGRTDVVHAPRGVQWIDNERAVQIVQSTAIAGVTWQTNYRAVEPRPIFQRGRLQYLISVIPNSGIVVSRSVIVDAASAQIVQTFNHEVNRAAEDERLRTYIRTGKGGQEGGSQPSSGAGKRMSSQARLLQQLISENERQRRILQQLLEQQQPSAGERSNR